MADGTRAELAQIPQPVAPSFGDVHIERVQNGFLITIGCKRFVMHSWKDVSEGLELYWKDPNMARLKYCTDEQAPPLKIRRLRGLLGNRRRKVGRRSKNK